MQRRKCALAFGILVSLLGASMWGTLAADELAEAQKMMRSRDFDGAVGTLARLVENEPQNGSAWATYGTALILAGQPDAALAALKRASKFEAHESTALYNIACIHATGGRKKQALAALKKAFKSGKIDPILAIQDADLQSLRGEKAFEALLPKAMEIRPAFVEDVEVIHEWSGETAGDEFGWIARDIGDVDGDGVHDLTTSAPSFSAGRGRVYVYSGSGGELLWSADGDAGFKLGQGIEAAGDVNGDGVGDVIAGAPPAGVAIVYSGSDGEVLHRFTSEQAGDNFGRSVADLGDWNGDGFDDVIVGAPGHDGNGADAGRVYVFSGKDGSILKSVDGENPNDNLGSSTAGWVGESQRLLVSGAPNAGTQNRGRVYVHEAEERAKFTIDADASGGRLGGMFVSVVGDVDGDGTPDVYASDWADSLLGRMTGRIYVHSGADGSRLHALGGGRAGDGFGIGPADAGDVNGDGKADLIVGSWRHSGAAPSGGKATLFSGADGTQLASYTCRVPGDTFGFDATGVGDVNGDGAIDFLITSAWSFTKGAKTGRIFIVSGRKRPGAAR